MDTFTVTERDEKIKQEISGTWHTASISHEDNGTLYPEYYVRFTDSEINYGYLKNGEFFLNHSDNISSIEKIATGGITIKAEALNGVKYTFKTSESDENILEYYETWNENEFAEMYRGGASLTRSN